MPWPHLLWHIPATTCLVFIQSSCLNTLAGCNFWFMQVSVNHSLWFWLLYIFQFLHVCLKHRPICCRISKKVHCKCAHIGWSCLLCVSIMYVLINLCAQKPRVALNCSQQVQWCKTCSGSEKTDFEAITKWPNLHQDTTHDEVHSWFHCWVHTVEKPRTLCCTFDLRSRCSLKFLIHTHTKRIKEKKKVPAHHPYVHSHRMGALEESISEADLLVTCANRSLQILSSDSSGEWLIYIYICKRKKSRYKQTKYFQFNDIFSALSIQTMHWTYGVVLIQVNVPLPPSSPQFSAGTSLQDRQCTWCYYLASQTCEWGDLEAWQLCPCFMNMKFIQPNKHEMQNLLDKEMSKVRMPAVKFHPASSFRHFVSLISHRNLENYLSKSQLFPHG